MVTGTILPFATRIWASLCRPVCRIRWMRPFLALTDLVSAADTAAASLPAGR